MPMSFADLPMEDQQRVLTMGLQQFRSGAPATKENMNRMREVLMNDAGYAKQIMTDAGVGGYSNDESGWVSPSQNAYSPDTFLAEDGTDEANGMTSNAPIPPGSRPPVGGMRSGSPGNAPVPPTRQEMAGDEQTTTQAGTSGGAVGASTDWGNILRQILLGGAAGAVAADGTRRYIVNRQMQMPPGTNGAAPYNDSLGGRVMQLPPGADGSPIPEGGAEIPRTANTATTPANRSPTEYTEYTEVPREQLEGPRGQLTGPESAVEQAIADTLREEPTGTKQVEQERRPQLEAPLNEREGVDRIVGRGGAAANARRLAEEARKAAQGGNTKGRNVRTNRPPRT